MGNTGGRRSKSKNDDAEASSSRRVGVVTSSHKLRRHNVDGEEQTERAGGGDGGVVADTAAVTVKLVMTRKEAVALASRLDARRQSSRARKARMAELKGELRAGGASQASCRAACWSPHLAPIKESYCTHWWCDKISLSVGDCLQE